MNNTTREELAKIRVKLQAISQELGDLYGDLENIKDDEQGKFDNLTEGLQASERGQAMQEAADTLGNAVEELESARTSLDSCLDYIETVE